MRDRDDVRLLDPAAGVTRRRFLRSACAAVGMTSLASTTFDLRRIAAAATGPADYRALVCVFLYGGNDGNNMVVPRGADHASYVRARGELALPEGVLRTIGNTPDGRQWGLHPALSQIHALHGQGKAAIVANVGPLVAPLTRAQYEAGGTAVPPQLFSHSDQTLHWQTSLPDQPARTGWGGRIADLIHGANGDPKLSMSMSLSGNNMFQVGNAVTQYQVSPDGSIGLGDYYDGNEWNHPPSVAIRRLLAQSYGNLFTQGYRDVFARALDQDRLLATALDGAPALATAFPDSDLGGQLHMVARLIAARGTLGLSRQVFFCATGGYDTHDEQVAGQPQNGAHADLLGELDAALGSFYAATVELGLQGSVTAFTASDFGRTYESNGLGSDHGWGSHHLVVGGSVSAGRIFGDMPVLSLDGPDDAGEGRWIPTTAVDEYAATLARWFGVASSDLPLVLPNLGRFQHTDLGFML
jgi:uncharacterized protein (DUF1501 family)